jgi:hypothetical protein
MIRSSFAIGLLALLIALPTSAPIAKPQNTEPGEGVICAWAIVATVVEMGQRCAPDRHPETQMAFRESLQRFRSYAAENQAGSEIEGFDIDSLQAQLVDPGTPDAMLCGPDAMQFFEAMISQSPEDIRAMTDRLVERPGPPSWGTCL